MKTVKNLIKSVGHILKRCSNLLSENSFKLKETNLTGNHTVIEGAVNGHRRHGIKVR